MPPAVARARVVVLASGGGSNLQALLDACRAPDAPAEVVAVVSDRASAGALTHARDAGVPAVVLADPRDGAELLRCLRDHRADLVVLAGYLKLVPPDVVSEFRDRMVNVHPALLPAFGGRDMYGRRVHEAVLASGARVSGPSVHVVSEEYDRGPVLAQWPVRVEAGDTVESLAARVLAAEHRLLPAVVLALAASIRLHRRPE